MRAPGASCSFNKSLRRREREKVLENGFLLPVCFNVRAPMNKKQKTNKTKQKKKTKTKCRPSIVSEKRPVSSDPQLFQQLFPPASTMRARPSK